MTEIEPLWDRNIRTIHPALDFILQDNLAVVSQWIPSMVTSEFKDNYGEIKQKKTKQDVLGVIFSNGEIFFPKEDKLKEIDFELFPNKIGNRWSLRNMHAFCNGSQTYITLEEIYNIVKEELKYYIDLPEEPMYSFLTLWAIGTYFFPLFNAYPYIFLNAIKRSGKSKVLRFMECICFNAKNSLSMTAATLFRLIQNSRCTLLIDEVEKIGKKDIYDFRSMLLAGYKKGAKVPRSQEMKGRKAFVVEEYDVYSPKMLANISGIEDILEDRCITLIMLRTKNKLVANREIDYNDEKWQNIRDKLYINLLKNWIFIKKNYDLIRDYISLSEVSVVCDSKNSELLPTNTPPIPSVLATQSSLTTLEQLKGVNARDAELWIPILSLSLGISDVVFSEMIDYCLSKIKEKEVENLTETTDIILLETLSELVENDDFYPIKDITTKLKEKFVDDSSDWIDNKWVGRALKRFGFLEKRRLGTGIEIRLNKILVANVAERFGIKKEDKDVEQKQEILSS